MRPPPPSSEVTPRTLARPTDTVGHEQTDETDTALRAPPPTGHDQVACISADTLVVSNNLERVVQDLMKQASQERRERVCIASGCDTKLSRYNKTPVCSIHTPPTLARAPHRW